MLKDQVTGETASNNKRPPIEMSAIFGNGEWLCCMYRRLFVSCLF